MVRYMTDSERKELKEFGKELLKSFKKIANKSKSKIDYDKLAEEQAQQDAYESGRVFF